MQNRELLIGVTGGIAAYKTAELVSRLVQAGANVSAVMTESAEQFLGASTLAALTGRTVYGRVFEPSTSPLGAHIELAERGELLCVAPATANFLAKAATGMADDLLSTLYLSFPGPVIVAPAMNCDMWEKPAVQRNVVTLRADGVHFVGPEEGWLSCRKSGAGRMASAEAIFEAIGQRLAG